MDQTPGDLLRRLTELHEYIQANFRMAQDYDPAERQKAWDEYKEIGKRLDEAGFGPHTEPLKP